MARARQNYYPALTGLRAFAQAMVFVSHYYYTGMEHMAAQPGWQLRFMFGGNLGVILFFTLSGYLITATYFDRFRKQDITFSKYWLKRFIRIYPLYAVLLTVLIINIPSNFKWTSQILTDYTLTQAYFSWFIWLGFFPAWSLTVEEGFYLLAPPIFFLLNRTALKPDSPNPVTRSAMVLTGTSALLLATGYLLHWMRLPYGFLEHLSEMRLYSIFGRLPEFCAGILVAVYFIQKRTSRLPRLILEAIPIVALSVLASFFVLRAVELRAFGFEREYEIHFFYNLAASAVAAALIFSAISGSTFMTRVFGNRLVEYLGRISFALYLLQETFFVHGTVNSIKAIAPILVSNIFGVYCAMSVVAALCYELVEKPIHRALLRAL